MPLKLVTLEATTAGLIAHYNVSHSTPGREGTTLEEPLRLCVRPDKCWCELEVKDCDATTPDEALERMAAWLRRLAEGIEKRGPNVSIPL